MANSSKLVPFILQWEGGFVNDPDDLGGATNKGITIGTFTEYRRKKGLKAPTVEDLKDISDAEWHDVFKSLYWDRWKADEIKNQSVANILVDWVWASGVHGIKRPQKLLGVAADGLVGPKTIAAINAADQRKLFDAIKADRAKFIDEICKARPKNEKYRKGWMNRINAIKYE
jgi:lysozyme family protein|nr:MAG TPA: Lysozyme [Caudoviricetes sp.]